MTCGELRSDLCELLCSCRVRGDVQAEASKPALLHPGQRFLKLTDGNCGVNARRLRVVARGSCHNAELCVSDAQARLREFLLDL